MTTRDQIETRLLQAVAVEPSEDGLRWLDQRVAQIAARPVLEPRRGFSLPRLILRPVALLAAFVLLTGAVVGALNLLERLVDSSGMPGWRVAFDNAEVLGMSQTDAGYTITLDRAYGDINEVMAFFAVESAAGLEAPKSSDGVAINHFILNAVDLRDPTGRMAVARTAIGDVEPGLAAAVEAFQFDVPPVAGTYQLTIRAISYGADGPACISPCAEDEIAGTWSFAFELPTPAGDVVAADVSDTVGVATLHLSELRVSPSMITARIDMQIAGKPVSTWSAMPIAVRHDAVAFNVTSAATVTAGAAGEGTGEALFFTTAGRDEVAGTWQVQIPELMYQLDGNDEVSLTGPWTLTVTVP
jgi:hypothetical protein